MASSSPTRNQVTKRCHWVPQGYLRAFAADNQKMKIWRLSHQSYSSSGELKPIKKVAVRHHLYVPVDAGTGKRDDIFEHKLSTLENWLGEHVWQAVCHDYVDLSWEPLRKMAGLIVAVMHLRNPACFEWRKSYHRQLVNSILAAERLPTGFDYNGKFHLLDSNSWPTFRDATDDDLKREWLIDVGQASWLAKKLMEMRWSVIVADHNSFVTSDNPVTFIHPSLEFRGIANPETSILFPLSPTRILCMDNLHDQPANQYYPLNHDPSSTNLLLWRGANDHMFSHCDPADICAAMLANAELQGLV